MKMRSEKLTAVLRISARIIENVMIVICIAVIALSVLPRAFGYRVYAVLSDSMGRTVPYGSLIFLKSVPFEEYKVGDIACFQSGKNPGQRFTHRIVKIDAENKSFTTKGDASGSEDPVQIKADLLVGKVIWSLPVAGLPAVLLKNTAAQIVLAVIIILWISAEIELFNLKRKKSKRKDCNI